MPPLAERAFRKSLTNRGPFERAYYLYGEDDYLKAQAAREMIEVAADPASRDFNLDVRDAAAVDAETLGSLLGTPPLMAERRVVLVKDVAALRKPARAVLDEYLKSPSADLLLILVASGGEKAKLDRALAERASAVEFAPLTGDRVPRWIIHHATTVLRVAITGAAADLLHAAVGNDLPALAAELEKLASYTGGGEIDEGAVSAVVGVRRGETLGDFLDMVARRDAARALVLLPHVLAQPKTSAVTVVMALTTQTLALGYGAATRGRVDFFDLLRGGGAMPGRSWTEAARAWSEHAARWTDASVEAALAALLAADMALKETRVESDEQILTTLVLAICATGAHDPPRAPGSTRRSSSVPA